jgi:hypothetical protein
LVKAITKALTAATLRTTPFHARIAHAFPDDYSFESLAFNVTRLLRTRRWLFTRHPITIVTKK